MALIMPARGPNYGWRKYDRQTKIIIKKENMSKIHDAEYLKQRRKHSLSHFNYVTDNENIEGIKRETVKMRKLLLNKYNITKYTVTLHATLQTLHII